MADEQHDALAAGRATSGHPAPEAGPGGCQFPTGPGGQTCGRPIEQSGGPGAPARYCDLTGHNRAKAFAARRSYALAAAGGPGAGRPDGADGTGAGVEALGRGRRARGRDAADHRGRRGLRRRQRLGGRAAGGESEDGEEGREGADPHRGAISRAGAGFTRRRDHGKATARPLKEERAARRSTNQLREQEPRR